MTCKRALTAYPELLSRTVAAPSWVMPGTVRDNALFLSGEVDEVGLCFFETAACLAYGENDLPEHLADLPLGWHVHLPGDLPWCDGGAEAAVPALRLMDKVAFLGAHRAVLHPPVGFADGAARLVAFVRAWEAAGRNPEDLCLENIRGEDLTGLWRTLCDLGCKVCLDMGHVLSYGQYGLLSLPGLSGRTSMLHVNAPGPGGRHLSLDTLDGAGCGVGRAMCALLPDDAVVMVEVFDWEGVRRSLPLLETWFAAQR